MGCDVDHQKQAMLFWSELHIIFLNQAYLPLLPTKQHCWKIREIVQKEQWKY
jgi:hypothetical protein